MYRLFWYDGHSGGVTPGPIPNPAVKSARVSVCTVLRKRTGTQVRCQPLLQFFIWFILHASFCDPVSICCTIPPCRDPADCCHDRLFLGGFGDYRKDYIFNMYRLFWYDGHSGGVTPGPIPNPAVKSARVSVCTVLRKRTGTQVRCQPLLQFFIWFILHASIIPDPVTIHFGT